MNARAVLARSGGTSAGILLPIALGAAVLVLSAAAAHAPLISPEVEVFRAVNGLPQSLYPVIWPFMQYGTFITIPALALISLLLRRVRLAIAMLIAGVGVYLLAKIVKVVVERGRPAALISGVEERETFAEGSLGFPSGHGAVAAALTFIVWRHLGPRWGVGALVLAFIVTFGRMYVGAHLPLDLVGGAGLGAVTAGVANLVAPAAPPSRADMPAPG